MSVIVAASAEVATTTAAVETATVAVEAAKSSSLGWFERAVETATGWAGLAIVGVYSFLIAFVLPLPSEIVLLAPLELGLPSWSHYGVIVLVSAAGKAAGSLLAFYLGHETKRSGPVTRALERSRFDVVEWSEKRTVQIARGYGYLGLAGALCVPGFPDTLSIYAFSILEDNYLKFAAATFVGSAGRLLLTLGLGAATLSV